MNQKESGTNIHDLLGEIGEFIKVVPTMGDGKVEGLSDKMARAQESLKSLRSIFIYPSMAKSGCTSDNPKIPKVTVMEAEATACTNDNPKIPKIHLVEMEKNGCTSDNPRLPKINVVEIEKNGCTSDNPRLPKIKLHEM